jgi:hypothetical protein
MTDEIERRLRDGLRNAPLPVAPESLRGYLADLPLEVPQTTLGPRPLRRPILLGAAAIAVLALGIGTVVFTGAVPAVPPTPTSQHLGFRTFEGPGIRFEYPADWTDQSAVVEYPHVPGTRYVALLGRGLSICPLRYDSDPRPTPRPGSCQQQATAPGSLIVNVIEYSNQLPGVMGTETNTTAAGYLVREPPLQSQWPDAASLQWSIQSPDGGLYVVMAQVPRADLAARRADIQTLLGTLRLSAWEVPPQAVNGYVHVDLPQGFSFDYPAGWTVYYPQDLSTMDSAVVTVASRPVAPPCPGDSCQRFTTPPGTIAIEFRVGNGPTAPTWSDAPTTIGGQPAFRQDWGPQNATGAEEGHTWSVRLIDPSVLGIYVSLRGPDLPALRAAMGEVLGSVRISQLKSPAP